MCYQSRPRCVKNSTFSNVINNSCGLRLHPLSLTIASNSDRKSNVEDKDPMSDIKASTESTTIVIGPVATWMGLRLIERGIADVAYLLVRPVTRLVCTSWTHRCSPGRGPSSRVSGRVCPVSDLLIERVGAGRRKAAL